MSNLHIWKGLELLLEIIWTSGSAANVSCLQMVMNAVSASLVFFCGFVCKEDVKYYLRFTVDTFKTLLHSRVNIHVVKRPSIDEGGPSPALGRKNERHCGAADGGPGQIWPELRVFVIEKV